MTNYLHGSATALIVALVASLAFTAGCGQSDPKYQPPAAHVNAPAPKPPVEVSEEAPPAPEEPIAEQVVEPSVEQPAEPETGTARFNPIRNSRPATRPVAGKTADVAPKAEPVAQPAAQPADRPEYFVGWPKPKLALVISGRQDGYIEPCGCAGLENQKGGLSRRHAFFQELQKRGWPLAAIDVGGQVRRFGQQAELQYALVADALRQMGYSGVGFGPADLRLSAGDVVAAVAGAQPEDSIFVSANVSLFGLTPKVRIVKAGGMTLGITSILGDSYRQQVNNNEVEILPAADALQEVMSQLDNCDVRILLAHATVAESEDLARKYPQFNFVVTAEGGDEPPAQPATISGTKTRLIEVGHKGMFVVVAGFYDDPKEPVRFQRVALDARFPDTAAMKQLMVTYQGQLQQLGWEGLGIRSMPHPRVKPGEPLSGQFAGTAACKDCHEAAWDVWSNSKHAHATDTLAKLDPPRQFDAECISCHATGWNPQEYYPYTGGFESLEKTAHLAENGCENCHGPGASHVAAENGEGDDAARELLRKQLHLTWDQAKTDMCTKCHDADNSPKFGGDVEHYWKEIAH